MIIFVFLSAKFWPEKITSRDGCFLLIRKNPQKQQGFFLAGEPLKSLEKKQKTLKKARISLKIGSFRSSSPSTPPSAPIEREFSWQSPRQSPQQFGGIQARGPADGRGNGKHAKPRVRNCCGPILSRRRTKVQQQMCKMVVHFSFYSPFAFLNKTPLNFKKILGMKF